MKLVVELANLQRLVLTTWYRQPSEQAQENVVE